jgi:putative sterol carrier protein
MTTYQYCTPEWLESSAKLYDATPKFKKALERLSVKTCFRVKADEAWGIEKDILFGAFVDKGELTRAAFLSEEEAKKQADYILAATPQVWKKILRKESKFVSDFMLGKIALEQGSKVGVMGIAPYSGTLVDVLTQIPLQFPDEMSPDELAQYRTHMREFRAKLCV